MPLPLATPAGALPALVPAHAPDTGLPPFTAASMLTDWALEPVPAVGLVLAAVLYLAGVRRLRARGDAWARRRTVAFVGGGLGSIALATQSALAVYDTTLLSVHMVQHMVLSMVSPILLGLGAPLTLALRTLGPRPRRLLLAILHSRWLRVVGHPAVAGLLFISNPWVLYFSGLYDLTLRNPLVHDLNHLHFLALGCLWFWSLIGVDPMPRASHPMRLIALFVSLPGHAFLGVTLMSSGTLIGGDWYAAHPRAWGPTITADQYLAGGILWSTGDLLAIAVLAVLVAQWVRASEREARRIDRELDRQEAAAAAQTPPVESGP